MTLIFHIARKAEWIKARPLGYYSGTIEDHSDGFIHFSTDEQIVESAAKHRAGETELILIACSTKLLGSQLKWEPSRNGDFFPHFYGNLPLEAVIWDKPLRLGPDNLHRFPPLK